MFNKLPGSLLFLSSVLALGSCDYARNRTPKEFLTNPFAVSSAEYEAESERFAPAPLRTPSSIVVCRSHQCAPAKISMSKEYVYNSLLHLFDNNNYQKVLICQADPYSHTCLENYITLPIKAGITPTNAYIDYVRVTDVIIGKQANKLNLILNYNVTYGGQVPDCTPSKSILFAKNVNHVVLEDAGYTCKMTALGQSTIKTVLAIDYIDLDYGYVGGAFSVGISGPAYGGGNGYMLLRFPKNAYPLAPELQAPLNTGKNRISKLNATPNSAVSSANKADGIRTDSGVQIFPINKNAE